MDGEKGLSRRPELTLKPEFWKRPRCLENTCWRSRLTLLEQADTGPRTVSRGPFLLRQASQQSEEERRSLESRSGFQQPFHINRLPCMRQEKSQPLPRTEFQRRSDGDELFSSCR